MNKRLGILLPVASLPGPHGIGEFGESSIRFISFLSKNHYKYWQILPLNPMGFGYSPYMSSCSKALDYKYISLDELYEDGFLKEKAPTYKKNAGHIDFEKVGKYKEKYLKIAFKNYMKGNIEGFLKFKSRHPWVNNYATFETFKVLNDQKPWNYWPQDQISYFDNHQTPPRKYIDKVNYFAFVQYIAFKQYKKVLSYARKKKIKIIADVPFYVGYDSMEVWMNKKEFLLDEHYNPTVVAGVPPDAFSDDGQLWGNPIYNFDVMRQNDYSLLVDRIVSVAKTCDYVRLDHFRAYDTYYVIPYGAVNAREGRWMEGPKDDFFNALYRKNKNIKFIAEDLGDLFPSVLELRDRLHLPGMFIAQFAILDDIDTSPLVVYTGTHDNQTLLGRINSLTEEENLKIAKKIKCRPNQLFAGFIEYVLRLPSYMTILPLQDMLRLDDRARINSPGTCGSPNFIWKMKSFDDLKDIKVHNKGKHYYGKRK